MKKSVHITLYSLFALIALLVITDIVMKLSSQQLQQLRIPFANPFWIIILVSLPILYGFVQILNSDSIEVDMDEKKYQQLEFNDKSNTIKEQLINRFENQIEKIQNNIFSKSENISESTKKQEKLLSVFCGEFQFSQGLIYERKEDDDKIFKLSSKYAFIGDLNQIDTFEEGLGVNGQIAKVGEPICLNEVPDQYMKIVSGLGESYPNTLLMIPIKDSENSVKKLIEVSGFSKLNTEELRTVYKVAQNVFTVNS